MESKPKYELKIDLSALNHLGINLYSNVPAVLSELIANAWDADACSVKVTIEGEGNDKIISIADDGCGMNVDDVNGKFLTIGYCRRKEMQGDKTPQKRRPVMGRKGIGKLSIFAIANHVEIYTKKDEETLGLKLVLSEIKKGIEKKEPYHPRPIEDIKYPIESPTGTIIILKDIKKRVLRSLPKNLKKRIARRFEVWSDDFNVSIDGKPVTIQDRDYMEKLEYVRLYGNYPKDRFPHLPDTKITTCENIPPSIPITGWIGFVQHSNELQEGDENLNTLPILARKKVAMEDIFNVFRVGGLYTKFLIGELQADFLDATDKEDIATSGRQDFLRTDERFVELTDFIKEELKFLENARAEYKKEDALAQASDIPAIKTWLSGLKGDSLKSAKNLFGKIYAIAVDEEHRLTLCKHGILAFEYLRHKEKLGQLDSVSENNIQAAIELFSDLDDIEASWYYQISRGRLSVINQLVDHTDNNALEKIVQKYIYDHLWLIDPSWDRATETPTIERGVRQSFKKISDKLSDEERKGRIDIRYKKTSGKHVIIELKRPNVSVIFDDLFKQIRNYKNALQKQLDQHGEKGNIEIICLVGKELQGWNDPRQKTECENALASINARVVTYQQLIKDAQVSYQEYLNKTKDKGRIQEILDAIDKEINGNP